MPVFRILRLVILLIAVMAAPVRADDAALRTMLNGLADADGFAAIETIVGDIAATGDPKAETALTALSSGDLYVRKADKTVLIGKRKSGGYLLTDPLTGEAAGEAKRGEVEKIKVNNTLRRVVRDALGGLTLASADPRARLNAAETIFKSGDAGAIPALDAALARETDPAVKERLTEARASAILKAQAPAAETTTALEIIAGRGDREALSLLKSYEAGAQGELKDAAASSIAKIEQTLAFWAAGQNVWYGISLGSVLLLAAVGLAITFGVMGVINMAHGEMVMIGAYTTFVVQDLIRQYRPDMFDWSLPIALPLAFLVSAAVGLIIERSIIRFLYGRPLETLLATWGVSLVLQQAVRSLFGPTNREVGNPSWMSGAFQLGELTITWNRLWIVVFALIVFALLLYVLNRTALGLQMRAVTQNRRMASSMGIRTPWVDAMTFALGSGIAGVAGVALSQIDNVSPDLGQGYIIDSFMVVVFGGVGNLWGTLVGAFTLGVLNKFLEPYAGAVLGKIAVLILIILFIQKRPRGLFALKGRAVEA
ncbi:urea ABC transporter permease subunit UrtB [Phyllobacterium phragmitis]|uniref:Urea ABC transporter permease subunit UrtB n=1 Tax=Phyllobacterium phragmitis TaxID=2670329 RepID=A0A2S9ILA6_9HYPH|nr:urea ABC transporter permease subunit UrtB [Phyllobacterium phragmitis]PRD41307.1 urea ABC transporter permease subunit UrtB [Phyllobacterium phragmitis]